MAEKQLRNWLRDFETLTTSRAYKEVLRFDDGHAWRHGTPFGPKSFWR